VAEPVYDIVVIGAGSAGAVVAARASEEPGRSVLLLDAGPDYPVLRETPYDLVNSHQNSTRDHDWGSTTCRRRLAAVSRSRADG
jgi:choline dehydrogenase